MHPIIAGPVFAEWYWGPIFIAIFVGIPLLMASLAFEGLLTLVLRWRGGRPRTTPAHFKTAGGFFLAGAIVLYGSFTLREHNERTERTNRALSVIDFGLYEPAPMPSDFRVLLLYPAEKGPYGPELIGNYSGPGGTMTVTQRASAPGRTELAGGCFLESRRPGGPAEFNPPGCRPRPTPGGRDISAAGDEIATRLGATRVSIDYDTGLPREALDRFVDALAATPKDDVRLVGQR